MVFPIVPLLAVTAIIGGAYTRRWYNSLSKEEQEKADARTGELAWKWFRRPLDELNPEQASEVVKETRRDFTN